MSGNRRSRAASSAAATNTRPAPATIAGTDGKDPAAHECRAIDELRQTRVKTPARASRARPWLIMAVMVPHLPSVTGGAVG
ncbi:hypothetical protein GCM10020369_48150 [Cryptosporangium minutisporangium]|uniref:Uncharacterized protein n=1 Tax=Cryptosporangium minutisporangium TaxID=113569 RepID=A0ABP6T2V6_9ACTN